MTKIEEDDDHNALLGKLQVIFNNYNSSKKGRKNPAHNFVELLQKAPRNCYVVEDLKQVKDECVLLIEVDQDEFKFGE